MSDLMCSQIDRGVESEGGAVTSLKNPEPKANTSFLLSSSLSPNLVRDVVVVVVVLLLEPDAATSSPR